VDAAHYVDPIGNRVLGFDHIKQVRGILSAERERERERGGRLIRNVVRAILCTE